MCNHAGLCNQLPGCLEWLCVKPSKARGLWTHDALVQETQEILSPRVGIVGFNFGAIGVYCELWNLGSWRMWLFLQTGDRFPGCCCNKNPTIQGLDQARDCWKLPCSCCVKDRGCLGRQRGLLHEAGWRQRGLHIGTALPPTTGRYLAMHVRLSLSWVTQLPSLNPESSPLT